jgi:hypothetical protein
MHAAIASQALARRTPAASDPGQLAVRNPLQPPFRLAAAMGIAFKQQTDIGNPSR